MSDSHRNRQRSPLFARLTHTRMSAIRGVSITHMIASYRSDGRLPGKRGVSDREAGDRGAEGRCDSGQIDGKVRSAVGRGRSVCDGTDIPARTPETAIISRPAEATTTAVGAVLSTSTLATRGLKMPDRREVEIVSASDAPRSDRRITDRRARNRARSGDRHPRASGSVSIRHTNERH